MKSKPHLVDVQVGQAIKYQRLMKRMSQTELGDRVGVSFQQIQKYEKGSNRISAGKLVDLAKALGVDVKTFFDDLTEITRSSKNLAPANDEFVISREGVLLNAAFLSIEDPNLRARLLNLVQAMAAMQKANKGSDAE